MRLRRRGSGDEVRRVLVATDRSETAERAVRFAASDSAVKQESPDRLMGDDRGFALGG